MASNGCILPGGKERKSRPGGRILCARPLTDEHMPPAERTRDIPTTQVRGDSMKRISLLGVMGAASLMAAPAAGASDAYARIVFTGALVNDACSSSMPLAGTREGIGRCAVAGATRAVYVEQTNTASDHSGVAMLDYFVERPGGGRKLVVTRQYR